jgi:hypothetical protein
MAQEPPQDKGRPQKQQLTAQGQNAQSGASAIAQTLCEISWLKNKGDSNGYKNI